MGMVWRQPGTEVAAAVLLRAEILIYDFPALSHGPLTAVVSLVAEFASEAVRRGGLDLILRLSARGGASRALLTIAETWGVPVFFSGEKARSRGEELLAARGAIPADLPDSAPPYLRRCPHFAAWWRAQPPGNRLESVDPRLAFQVGPGGSFVFFWAAKVSIWVAAEGRSKSNEIVFSRPDIHHVVAWHRPPKADFRDTQVVLVREFRSPGRTTDGFVREVPGGSASKAGDLANHAAREFSEETGFGVDVIRLKPLGSRQVSATTSTHHAHAFSLKLTAAEMKHVRSLGPAGQREETELTTTEVYRLGDLLDRPLTDWANLGMILVALQE